LIPFHKYHGAGNDFILLDDRAGNLHEQFDQANIAHWCHRRFGIGADGLMLLRSHPDFDFEMIYYNSDGAPSSMCGNGGRCIVRFAHDLNIERKEYRFLAVDGPHRAKLLNNGWVSLEMLDVEDISEPEPGKVFVLDTGSPHYITFVEDSDAVNVFSEGRAIRNSAPYAKKGINVSFVSTNGKELKIATYERGVEDETLACGTGVTAAAIAAVRRSGITNGTFHVPVKAKGGDLAVRGTLRDGRYTSLWLEGGAVRVFGGEL
jgi:diaminopimelate epimerase